MNEEVRLQTAGNTADNMAWERENSGFAGVTPQSYQLTSASDKALKFDQDKIRLELLPPELLTETGKILTFGAKKYADRNWELGMDWSRVFGALNRHLWAWWGGQAKDPETGESHLAHAACCIAFLLAYEQRGVGTDDRQKINE